MPFKSQAQRRKFYAMASRGEISKSTVKEWEGATPKGKRLPERVKQAAILNKLREGVSSVARSPGKFFLSAIQEPAVSDALIGGGLGALGGGLYGWGRPMDPTGATIEKDPTTRDKLRGAMFSGSLAGLTGLGLGATIGGIRGIVKGSRAKRSAYRALENARQAERRIREVEEELRREVRNKEWQDLMQEIRERDKGKPGSAIREIQYDLLREAREASSNLFKTGSLTKEAIDPLTIAGLGALSHVGSNIATKALHGPLTGRRAAVMGQGIRRGISGQAAPAWEGFKRVWLGPEHAAPYGVGNFLGEGLRGLTTGQQYRYLKKLRKSVAMSPQLRSAPITEDIVGGVNRALASPLPKAGPKAQQGLASRLAPYAAAPIVAATEPAALVHGGINLARDAVSRSQPGKDFFHRTFLEGLADKPVGRSLVERAQSEAAPLLTQGQPVLERAKKLLEGVRPGSYSGVSDAAYDYLLSPAALAPRRVGQAMSSMMETPEGQRSLRRVLGSLGPQVRSRLEPVLPKNLMLPQGLQY